MANWLEQLEKWLGGGPGGEKRVKTFRRLLWIGLIGVVIMLLQPLFRIEQPVGTTGLSPPEMTASEQAGAVMDPERESEFLAYEKKLEERVKHILERMAGVQGVEVMITIESSEEQVMLQNERDTQQVTEENDRNGGRRHITEVSKSSEIVFSEGGSGHNPVVLKTIRPVVSGVVVVAGGAENATVRQMIVDAVHKGLDVPPQRISVVPGKQRRS